MDSFMSQINSGFLLALPGRASLGFCMENNNCTQKWLLGLLFRPYCKVQLSSDTWCLYNTSASQMNQLVTILISVCS